MNQYEKEHLRTVKKYLAECMVLLKSNGDFPISEPCKLALYGSGARRTIKGGTGSGEVNSRFSESIEAGLTKRGFEITTKSWLDSYDEIFENARKEFKKYIKVKAKQEKRAAIMVGMGLTMPEPEYKLPINGEGDLAVYVLSRVSGEGQDRKVVKGDYLLSDTEVRDILEINKKYDKFLLVLNVGGPVDLTPVLEVENILLMSQLGVISGRGLADVMLGRDNPSGKLATTWASYDAYPDILDFGNTDNTRYLEGIYVGYRYFDNTEGKVMFPFGYGLTYTSFDITCDEITNEGEKITLNVKVKNTGARSGKEVVQVYVSKPGIKLDAAFKELAAFAKTKELVPGEEQMLSISFNFSDLVSFSPADSAYILEAGDYKVKVGNSSTNVENIALINLKDEVIVKKVKSVFGQVDFNDYVPENKKLEKVSSKLPKIKLKAKDIPTVEVNYEKPVIIPEVIQRLSDEDLVKLNVGGFSDKAGIKSVIGAAGQKVAGAAGETATVAGLPVYSMADGPAGLRLSKNYYEGDGVAHSIGSPLPQSMVELMNFPMRMAMKLMTPKPKKYDVIKHQYATMIPIGTAIAQSFNTEMAECLGDLVGDEMERFNVQLWLAPALNIHRSVLCGRNFEYYSEDPLVSGKMAAAITRGVQKHPNCGTTIKHFAANNQENNRYRNNSMVSERAMREIYLKGFEICVKESNPVALMTSYNLINGTHTSEHAGLVIDILRKEWNYEGIVMTDWIVSANTGDSVTKYRDADPAEVVKAGNAVIMPGGQGDYDKVMAALKEGKVTRLQLMENVSCLVR